jgi:hypothetical protein
MAMTLKVQQLTTVTKKHNICLHGSIMEKTKSELTTKVLALRIRGSAG